MIFEKDNSRENPMDEPSQGLAAKGMLADPGDHFKGRFEVERKYAVSEPAEIRARLESLGAVPFTLANSEMDIFLDWPDGQLAAAGKQQVVEHIVAIADPGDVAADALAVLGYGHQVSSRLTGVV